MYKVRYCAIYAVIFPFYNASACTVEYSILLLLSLCDSSEAHTSQRMKPSLMNLHMLTMKQLLLTDVS
jgi:hypothetical protein